MVGLLAFIDPSQTSKANVYAGTVSLYGSVKDYVNDSDPIKTIRIEMRGNQTLDFDANDFDEAEYELETLMDSLVQFVITAARLEGRYRGVAVIDADLARLIDESPKIFLF